MAAGENAEVDQRGPVQSTLGVLLKAVEMAASSLLKETVGTLIRLL